MRTTGRYQVNTTGWKHSSQCSGGGCIEWSHLNCDCPPTDGPCVAIRSSRDQGRVLVVKGPEWRDFINGVRAGDVW